MESNHTSQPFLCAVHGVARKQKKINEKKKRNKLGDDDGCVLKMITAVRIASATRIFLQVGVFVSFLWFYFALILSITSAPPHLFHSAWLGRGFFSCLYMLPSFIITVALRRAISLNSEDDYIMNNTIELMTSYLHTNTIRTPNEISIKENAVEIIHIYV